MPTRRTFLQQMSVVAGLGAAASFGLPFGGTRARAAESGRWFMPDEGEKHQRAYIAFGAQDAIWEDFTEDVQAALGRIARAIAAFQPVTVFCRASERDIAEEECGSHNITYVETELDDIWMRDIGANFVVDDDGVLGAVDFNFNGWGGKQQHRYDAKLAARVARLAGAQYQQSELVGEGGGIEVDGHGTGIMTESSWINSNRNPGWSKAQVEAELKERLGLRKIIWLPGIKGKDITDAHVDFYARFAAPGVVVANLDNDPDSYDHKVTLKHLEILRNATDADGRKLEIHTMSPPLKPRRSKFSEDNPDFAAGYINYFVINGAVIAPQFGDRSADEKARALLVKLYPGRKVVQLDIDAIAAGGGGIHCVTNQCPAV
ncbi:agmatine deiminase family protein [Pseudomonas mosselii]|uniref:agmatine deiminase family protein n=1 Tax=Pseudomonas mosselii TaxID=78327 RepID=UPI00244A5DFB|nr:agmatine deiminase family protein [Pseudomonas mosselii]MDH0628879.1 agmatine deiminase family protein [Pseudomonas mosselii]MDH0677985.1 agmatine deiminase family protein [Pseudomonas mosselii]MDH0924828.1 agmatine deiminase family protein [Pseudomonas mosselii]MDH1134611.1 agmatine deiminase family protein [Pseudomonas mosselii]MDH1138524.1 agmatine deiminase family protein [Pseudomonas mosselii]